MDFSNFYVAISSLSVPPLTGQSYQLTCDAGYGAGACVRNYCDVPTIANYDDDDDDDVEDETSSSKKRENIDLDTMIIFSSSDEEEEENVIEDNVEEVEGSDRDTVPLLVKSAAEVDELPDSDSDEDVIDEVVLSI